MAKPTTEELQAELDKVISRHNQAQEIVKECQTKFIELNAIIKDTSATNINTDIAIAK